MPPQSETAETARMAIDSAIGGNATKATVAGAATLMYGGYTLSDIAMAVGAVVAIISLLVQTVSHVHSSVVREREDRRRDEIHKMRMRMMIDKPHIHKEE